MWSTPLSSRSGQIRSESCRRRSSCSELDHNRVCVGSRRWLDHRDHTVVSSPTADLKNSSVTEESENERRRWEWRQELGGFSLAQISAISATSEEPSFAGEVTGSPERLPFAGSVQVSNARNHRRARHRISWRREDAGDPSSAQRRRPPPSPTLLHSFAGLVVSGRREIFIFILFFWLSGREVILAVVVACRWRGLPVGEAGV
ncbi:hypothetical protein TIFTF001_040196 [Ficus carica]|uniref:Uncharacterized protein n=1 Tax=Ficus carica TaxID=3494 RepID=A0AA87YSZ3_FICCA|nr:hypothetical protein TIFTF001_040188 [Ficus carica]GMN22145.1 hypothetical protein TIFTF001_040191 [Ficus carica]GMN22153.1 hypothetical protein TIFTF001_040193 [Ficus carica]GMN22168.1 hypothetical protein TIFTF001_040196 [Ficus carica]